VVNFGNLYLDLKEQSKICLVKLYQYYFLRMSKLEMCLLYIQLMFSCIKQQEVIVFDKNYLLHLQ